MHNAMVFYVYLSFPSLAQHLPKTQLHFCAFSLINGETGVCRRDFSAKSAAHRQATAVFGGENA
jgi:hypothetical protein